VASVYKIPNDGVSLVGYPVDQPWRESRFFGASTKFFRLGVNIGVGSRADRNPQHLG
jgi:hypothetical protein